MGAFKLGKMTLGSLFKKPETLLYPFQTEEPPAGLKGRIGIQVESCILCGLCQRSCTTGCITVSKPEAFWEINRYQCVQCGYCITVCPKSCLYMLPTYAPVAPEKVAERFAIPVAAAEKRAKRADDASKTPSSTSAKAQKAPAATEKGSTARQGEEAAPIDRQVESLLSLMDGTRAAKVRENLK